MTRTLFDPPLDLLERRFQALQERAASLPGASRQELETALQELSQAIAALRAEREAEARPPTASPRCDTILQHLFNAIPDLLTVHDRDFNTIMSNWHGHEFVPEAERQGQPKCYRVYHHRDRPCDNCHTLEVLATGQPVKVEKVNPVDGRVWQVSAYPIRDESGRVVLVVEHVRDITERKLAEEALKESEGRFRTLIEDSPESLVLTDVQGTILAASRVAARRRGKELAEVSRTSVFEHLPPEVVSRRRALFEQVIATGRPVRFEDARGNEHFDINFNPILDADGKVFMLSILAIDITDIKNAEKALKESEERFRMLFEHAPDAYFLMDLQGNFLDVNRGTEELTGYGREEFMGRNYQALPLFDERQNSMVAARFQQAVTGKIIGPAELNLNRKDGGNVIIEAKGLPLHRKGESLLLGIVRDITARRQAEAALKESEARFRHISSTISDICYSCTAGPDGSYAIDWLAGAAERITGYSVEEIKAGRCWRFLVIEADQPLFEKQITGLAAGSSGNCELRLRHKNGGIVWVALFAEIVQEPDQPELLSMYGGLVDITAHKAAEAALRESEQRFRLMAETIQDVFWIATPDLRRVIYLSPAFEQIWGRRREELYQAPRNFLEAVHPEDRRRVRAEMLAAQAQGTTWSHEYRIIKPDGAVRWFQDRGFPVRDDQGRVTLFTGVAADVTERKALEAQLLQAQKMEAVGRLAGGVAHDFNNLLMAIMGYGELMRATVLKDDPLYGYLENILKAGDRATALTQQLLTFSRQKIVHPQVVDLNRVVLVLEPMLRRLIGEDLHLEVVTDLRLGAVKADPGHLGQIIMNLVVNARDAMPRGGRLTLKTAPVELKKSRHTRFGQVPPGAYVMLVVADTGVGMDEATQAHIFEPFFTTKEPGKGTGLGLSTVYGIVRQSGGYLNLASEPGAGSTFTIYLPRLEAIVEPPKAKIHITASFRGEETVLLVEDEDVLRALLAKFLRLYGYSVLEARHGGEALLTCERHQGPIHLMVTDVMMPQMSGRELADRLTPLRPEMKVLYMSGHTEDALVQHGVTDLSVAFLQKPFRPIELARRVHAVLHPPVSQ